MAKRKCITKEILEKIREKFKGDKEVSDALEDMKTCRAKSKYQEFVSKCMKEDKNATIPSCAKKWRALEQSK
jgi:hypothetical protein